MTPKDLQSQIALGEESKRQFKAEIPESVFEELLVNALVHRDYLVNATIRIFIFDNRIEIISPGHLPNNLTVEKIRAGNSNIRNPILVSYVAKGLLPYHGLGSGIKRALDQGPQVAEESTSGKMKKSILGQHTSHTHLHLTLTADSPDLLKQLGRV